MKSSEPCHPITRMLSWLNCNHAKHVHAIIMIDGEHLFSSTAKMSLERAVATFSPPEAGSLSAIIRSYKAGVTRRAREARCAEDVWQAGLYDHILRGEK